MATILPVIATFSDQLASAMVVVWDEFATNCDKFATDCE